MTLTLRYHVSSTTDYIPYMYYILAVILKDVVYTDFDNSEITSPVSFFWLQLPRLDYNGNGIVSLAEIAGLPSGNLWGPVGPKP